MKATLAVCKLSTIWQMKLYNHLVPSSGDGEGPTLEGQNVNQSEGQQRSGRNSKQLTSARHQNLTCDEVEYHSVYQSINDSESGVALVGDGVAKQEREGDIGISDEPADVSPVNATLRR